ncbi:Nicotianamine synthase [Lichtheimia hyalospora FSU 10163]|nr:Nicotianamine synthase [Lichtheimia hyalospora FSU 10163]
MTCTTSISGTATLMKHHKSSSPVASVTTLQIIKRLQQIHSLLVSMPSLAPSDAVNGTFGQLVNLCIGVYPTSTVHSVMNHPLTQSLLPSLRTLASKGEYLLEKTWAQDLARKAHEHAKQARNPTSILQEFVYYDNYEQLVKMELHCLLGVDACLDRVVFVGSGPLPLSSMLLARHCQFPVTNIDYCKEAIHISTRLVHSLQLQDKMHFFCGDATEYPFYQDADVVILGALVGANGDVKLSFLDCIAQKMKPGAILLVRSAHALRTVLYPPLDEDGIPPTLAPLLEMHPQNQVVNSVILFKKN